MWFVQVRSADSANDPPSSLFFCLLGTKLALALPVAIEFLDEVVLI